MAVNSLTAKQISSLSVGLLARDLILAGTVVRIPGGEFAGDNGDTVTVRVPSTSSAEVQANPGDSILYQNVNETAVDVTMNHIYNAVKVSDEALSLDLENFGAQVTRVQVEAVSRRAEDELSAVMNGLASDNGNTAPTETNIEDEILTARETLSAANVPAAGRYLAVAPDVSTMLLKSDKFTRVNESGSDDALREATIGRLYGFTIVESNALTSTTAVAYHRSGLVLANRTPVMPRGASDSATASAGGFSLRHIFQYDPSILSDVSVLSTFAGSNVVSADRVYKISA